MSRRMKDFLAKHATENFIGRKEEISSLLECLEGESPLVVQIHGIGGVGKSALLEAFSAQARERGAKVMVLDCRLIEPTERGFLQELGNAVGADTPTVEEAANKLERLGSRVFLALETYEVFRLMDTWLRQIFVPSLTENIRVILVGRALPAPAWLTAHEWQGLFCSIALGPLRDKEAQELLTRSGVRDGDTRRIYKFAGGHPLTLKLAASAAIERPGLDLQEMAEHKVIRELTRLFLIDVGDAATREALEAASVARRITQSLLGAMLPNTHDEETYEKLSALTFVESTRDGLRIHDVVHDAIAASLRASDPSRYLEYQRAAWRQLSDEVRKVGTTELWRYTADMLYLIENPAVREAFFPSGSQHLVVEPAREEDSAAIHKIAEKHEGPEAAKHLRLWWDRFPESFHIVRGEDGVVVGFYCCFDPDTVDLAHLEEDPLVRLWWQHLKNDQVPKNQMVLFLRRWLSRDHGEAPSPIQAACWLDIKRTYMELRPKLRRVYLTVIDLPPYGPAATKLGFVPFSEAMIDSDGAAYQTAMLDFGPSSVDGWLAGLAADEMGIEKKTPETELHYKILDKLGVGGMGVVYRAEDMILERQVALKFLPQEFLHDEERQARFLREARTAAALNHPNICTIFEVDQVVEGAVVLPEEEKQMIPEGSPFISMELVDGSSLRHILDHSPQLSLEQLLDVAVQIAEGLAEAHSHGFVHRDIKPQNVMVTSQGRLKILDFGVAKAVQAAQMEEEAVNVSKTLSLELTRQGMIVGTLSYMSPEQVEGQEVDSRSDIFSFGTILYEMAAGKNPFKGKTATSTMSKVLEVNPEPPSNIRSGLPEKFEEIILRCLAKKPEDRYNDTRDLLTDLKGLQKSGLSKAS